MEYNVRIYNGKNEIISDEIWYGGSEEQVKIWVEFAINSITLDVSHYTIEDLNKLENMQGIENIA